MRICTKTKNDPLRLLPVRSRQYGKRSAAATDQQVWAAILFHELPIELDGGEQNQNRQRMKRLQDWIGRVLCLTALVCIMAGCGPAMEARMNERATAKPCGCLTDTLKTDTTR